MRDGDSRRTHSNFSCGECTITLEDVKLQLGLPVDESVLTGSVQSVDWGAICYDLLGVILDNVYGGRIDIRLVTRHINDSTEVERIRYVRAYILEIIGGYLMPDLSQTSWNHSVNYVGIPTALEDIRLLLDQRLEVHTLYKDPAIWVIIPDKFFQNLNIWHVKVTLVNYATVEMHKTNRLLRQFRFQQLIPVTPEVLDNEHEIDLRQSNTHWLIFFSEYIKIWKNRYDHIPTRELAIVLELACAPDYML
ncbi:hypothetical protein PVK06_047828 [Gossypium arboreum]|uniref:Aminotransferase-like plant mobile domain-containing protein n=1 Tax=Gossypium arboreum TaxID=29729 RepID=A0ABR0MET9_GOSAR|nr:hypothetical protein PVK06_047828 [Gossypium arboreum]